MDATPTTPAAPRAAAAQLPPGPRLPMAVQTLLWILRPERVMRQWHDRYGDIFTVRLIMAGNVVQVCEPSLIKAVFAAKPDDARAGEANAILEPLLGRQGLLTLDGRQHLRQRKLLLPAFHGERMQRYGEVMAEVTARELQTWTTGTPFPLRPAMQRITLDVILRAVFGMDAGPEMDELRPHIRDLIDVARHRTAMVPQLRWDWGERSPWGRFLRTREQVDRMLYALIERRRTSPDLAERDDVLSMMLLARDEDGEPLGDVELRDELMTLMLAGHETTATSLAWALYFLLRDPEEMRRLREDIDAGSTTRLDAVIKETMRLRPVVPVVARYLHAPLQVGEWTIPAGTVVAPNIEVTHHRDDLYPEPDAFRPDRFVGRNVETYEWLPFGGGIRRCIGASFAIFEMRTVIPVVLRLASSLRLADTRPEKVRRQAVTMVPARGVRVVLDA